MWRRKNNPHVWWEQTDRSRRTWGSIHERLNLCFKLTLVLISFLQVSEYDRLVHSGGNQLQEPMILEPIELDGGDGWRMIFETEEMLEIMGGVEEMDEAITWRGGEEENLCGGRKTRCIQEAYIYKRMWGTRTATTLTFYLPREV